MDTARRPRRHDARPALFLIMLAVGVTCAILVVSWLAREAWAPADREHQPRETVQRSASPVANRNPGPAVRAAPPASMRPAPPSAAAPPAAAAEPAADSEPATPVHERIAEIRRAVEQGAVEALPDLEQTVLTDEPEVAPTVILSIPQLANAAGEAERERAADTLGRWLDAESTRAASDPRGDARGNVSLIVSALGDLESPAAVDVLSSALAARRLPLHVETAAVEGLFKRGDARALPAVERFLARIEAMPQGTGFEEELRQEALLTARAARARLDF